MTAAKSLERILSEESAESLVQPMDVAGKAATAPRPIGLSQSPERFVNRELSWLRFNRRVMEEASNRNHPLLEQLRFLSISANNLDEFFMVRVSGLREQLHAKVVLRSQDGLTPAEQLEKIGVEVATLASDQQQRLRELRAGMAEEGIVIADASQLTALELNWLEGHFLEHIFPVLTPLAIDPAHPFPFIPNLAFSLGVRLARQRDGRTLNALVRVPQKIARFVRLPDLSQTGQTRFVELEQIIGAFAHKLFPGHVVKGLGGFRVIRDSDLEIEEEAEDLLRMFETLLKRRRRGDVIRLEVEARMPEQLRSFLGEELDVTAEETFVVEGMLALNELAQLIGDDRPDLKFKPYTPRFPERVREHGGDCFAAIREKDFVVHHPYEILRRGGAVPAAGGGRSERHRDQADALPHLVGLADRQDARGGGRGRQVGDRARRAQGAFRRRGEHPLGARSRTGGRAGRLRLRGTEDARQALASGAARGWPARELLPHRNRQLSSSDGEDLHRSFLFHREPRDRARRDAHLQFHHRLCRAGRARTHGGVARDPEKAPLRAYRGGDRPCESGPPAAFWGKCNSLVDPQIIDALYRASEAGVRIELIVRGICCLKPGVPGLSENIRIKSIVGRFLEHGRIYCFGGGYGLPHEKAHVYISSADLMTRNLDRRVEALLPIDNPTVHEQILDQIMVANLRDNQQSWRFTPQGMSERIVPKPGEAPFNAHHYFMTNPSLSGRGRSLREIRTEAPF